MPRARLGAGVPGPGQYEVDKPGVSKKYAFGKETRDRISKPNANPAPGTYAPNFEAGIKFKHAGVTKMGKSNRLNFTTSTGGSGPPVGSYTPNLRSSTKDSMISTKVGTEKQRPPMCMNAFPGPGEYNSSKVLLKRDPTWSIGHAERSTFGGESIAPGPGNYDHGNQALKQRFASAPTHVMAARLNNPTGNVAVPGPGTYPSERTPGVETFKKAPAFSFGTSNRDDW